MGEGDPILLLLIALIGGLIAYRQVEVSAHAVRLDLFDRRYKVFEEFNKILGLASIKGIREPLPPEDLKPFLEVILEAEFLFDKEIPELMSEGFKLLNEIPMTSEEIKELRHGSPESKQAHMDHLRQKSN